MPDILALPFNEQDVEGFREQLSSGCVCSFCQINRRWLATYDQFKNPPKEPPCPSPCESPPPSR